MDKYQTIFPRLGALIIDGIILAPISYLFSFVSILFVNNAAAIIVLQFLASFGASLYTILLHAKYGQTIGKKAFNVKVVDISESDISFQQSIIRSSPQLVQLLFIILIQASSTSTENVVNTFFLEYGVAIYSVLMIGWYIADIFVAIAHDKHRALHDFIAGTIVIKTN